MKILVSGSHGFLGSASARALKADGHDVLPLLRKGTREDPDFEVPPGGEAVLHLAGESVLGRWTAGKKRRIRGSRVAGTRRLCEALARLPKPPSVLLAASATGYYGDRGEEVLTEDSPPGAGFLAGVCGDWEAACAPLAAKGARVVHIRTGIVLSPRGGALRKMLPPFRLGVGGRLGSGRQYMSWISLDDWVGAMRYALRNSAFVGPVNFVAPSPATNSEFTKALGRALRRPTVFSVPAFAARALFGQMAEEVLLSGARVQPSRLSAAGYRFRHADINGALSELLTG